MIIFRVAKCHRSEFVVKAKSKQYTYTYLLVCINF